MMVRIPLGLEFVLILKFSLKEYKDYCIYFVNRAQFACSDEI